ncbi:30099_t:CDS:1, partial [Gigaspora margarita]
QKEEIKITSLVIENNWEEKLNYLYNILKGEKYNKQSNNESLETYFQIEELLIEKDDVTLL